MSDLISRQDAIDALAEEWYHNEEDYRTAVQVIGALPSAEKTGKWEHEDGVYGIAFCSNCEFELRMNDTNYCPNCGARMECDTE